MKERMTDNNAGSSTRIARLCRHGRFLDINPAYGWLGPVLLTRAHLLANDERGGCRISTEAPALGTGKGLTVRTGAGLEALLSEMLRRAAVEIQEVRPLPPLTMTRIEPRPGLPPVDVPLLEALAAHGRVIVRYDAEQVDAAWLVAQIGLAYPEATIGVVETRKRVAQEVARRVRRCGLPASGVTSSRRPAEIQRVVVGTVAWVTLVTLERCGILVALNGVEMLTQLGCSRMDAAIDARVVAFLPLQQKVSPREQDLIRAFFGFQEVEIPRHGCRRLPVDVVSCPIAGGPDVRAGDGDLVQLCRTGIWQHPVRNRRIAALARSLADADRAALRQRFPKVATAVDGDDSLSVVILVNTVEHGLALARLLPDWRIVAGPEVWTQGLSQEDREVFTRPLQPGRSIVTATALPTFDLTQIDVMIRADGGIDLPPIPAGNLVLDNTSDHWLLLVDFEDRHHPALRRRSRMRHRAYREAGWYAPGANPVTERFRDFVATRKIQ